jgi:hypothetical protein
MTPQHYMYSNRASPSYFMTRCTRAASTHTLRPCSLLTGWNTRVKPVWYRPSVHNRGDRKAVWFILRWRLGDTASRGQEAFSPHISLFVYTTVTISSPDVYFVMCNEICIWGRDCLPPCFLSPSEKNVVWFLHVSAFSCCSSYYTDCICARVQFLLKMGRVIGLEALPDAVTQSRRYCLPGGWIRWLIYRCTNSMAHSCRRLEVLRESDNMVKTWGASYKVIRQSVWYIGLNTRSQYATTRTDK